MIKTKREAKKRRKRLLKMAKRLRKEAYKQELPVEKFLMLRMATNYEDLAAIWDGYIKRFE